MSLRILRPWAGRRFRTLYQARIQTTAQGPALRGPVARYRLPLIYLVGHGNLRSSYADSISCSARLLVLRRTEPDNPFDHRIRQHGSGADLYGSGAAGDPDCVGPGPKPNADARTGRRRSADLIGRYICGIRTDCPG